MSMFFGALVGALLGALLARLPQTNFWRLYGPARCRCCHSGWLRRYRRHSNGNLLPGRQCRTCGVNILS